ncbi:MAG: efflux RND transporter periplasmic adaptor subunit [Alistipes sp.]|nr:efflux RND transporter periplasmic adaptor subunit [Rikenellaceae bacterium]MBQ3212913.1 efflux RND transporter periplasmic adaptor subunit [Alistipes sp.]
MDIKLEKKRGWRALLQKKNIPYAVVGLFVMFIVAMLLRDGRSTLRVDAQMLSISEVRQAEFNDYVRLTGSVQPITTVQLSPLEAGIVERIVAEEGEQVKRGDVIVELSNNNLSMQILQSEADLAEKQNILRNTLISMEQQRLTLRQEQLQLDLEVQRKRRTFEQNDELYRNNLLARETWLQSKEDYELSLRRRELIMERQRQDSLYRTNQVVQMESDLNSMSRNMQLIRQRVDNLKVKAPIDGEVGMLDVVLGQSISSGASIGQVNDLSAFKVTAQIDEHYIDRIVRGLTASFERQDHNYQMTLSKVYPEVREGQFRADFIFSGDIPDNIRSGQTYYMNLQLGQSSDALLIPRGAFYQTTGGAWVYVLDASGERAYRRMIRIGRQNPQYYEVVEGLQAGERVITSGYENFGTNEVLILKK